MKAVITVVGKDTVGIIAKVSQLCQNMNANISDISQKVMGDLFVMIMLVEIDKLNVKYTEFVDAMNALGDQEGLKVHTMHEDIFNAMHRV
ncbi:MAG: ACT domain-containing protein [Clostridiales bacterium]|nr:ACT domain-containing protein [Clostridiales bacterium]